MFFVRRNKFTKQREFKFVNRYLESHLLGNIVSRRITSKYKSTIYKQETEEVQLVNRVISNLLAKNNLSKFLPSFKVVVIHNDTYI